MPPETRASLILRLQDAQDVAAWDEVVAVYGPLVYRLARRKGLQPVDADDLCQVRLVELAGDRDEWREVKQSLSTDKTDSQIESEQASRIWSATGSIAASTTWTDSVGVSPC